jgi:hypothetical protein
MSNSTTEVLVKIDCPEDGLLMDHRILSLEDSNKLSQLFADKPDFIVSLSGPNDWEKYLKDFKLEIINDVAVISAFRLVYPKGINTIPIYYDIWQTVRDNEDEANAYYSDE